MISTLATAKASILDERDRKLFYAIFKDTMKFAVVIQEKKLPSSICKDIKSKQRYLDFAYEHALRKAFEEIVLERKIDSGKSILKELSSAMPSFRTKSISSGGLYLYALQ